LKGKNLDLHFINLQRRPDRREKFEHMARVHGKPIHETTIDGPNLPLDVWPAHGINLAKLPYYNARTAGNHLSHKLMWEKAAQQSQPFHCFEDDAILHDDFARVAPEILACLPDDWDILMWGWTMACQLAFQVLPGCRTMYTDVIQAAVPQEIELYHQMQIEPQLFRAIAAWNSFAYSLSPAGAKKLLSLAWPILPENGVVAARSSFFPIYGVDAKLAAILPLLNAWITVPPLAYHPHDMRDSNMNSDPPKPGQVCPQCSRVFPAS
jgi:GR25 family glycosyltransferase involved in LPS biosynthesis